MTRKDTEELLGISHTETDDDLCETTDKLFKFKKDNDHFMLEDVWDDGANTEGFQ